MVCFIEKTMQNTSWKGFIFLPIHQFPHLENFSSFLIVLFQTQSFEWAVSCLEEFHQKCGMFLHLLSEVFVGHVNLLLSQDPGDDPLHFECYEELNLQNF